jgi:hypothetical protein
MKTLLLSIALFVFAQVSFAQFSGGSGTKSDPFQVATAVELDSVRHHAGHYFLQTADIDLSGTVYDQTNSASNMGWVPLGENYKTIFSGQYDGGGYAISNLFVERLDSNYVGLFGYTEKLVLKNITLVDAYVSGGIGVGLLVGFVEEGSIINCKSSGEAVGTESYTGGLVGTARY